MLPICMRASVFFPSFLFFLVVDYEIPRCLGLRRLKRPTSGRQRRPSLLVTVAVWLKIPDLHWPKEEDVSSRPRIGTVDIIWWRTGGPKTGTRKSLSSICVASTDMPFTMYFPTWAWLSIILSIGRDPSTHLTKVPTYLCRCHPPHCWRRPPLFLSFLFSSGRQIDSYLPAKYLPIGYKHGHSELSIFCRNNRHL